MIIDNDIFWNNFNFHQGKPPFAAGTRAPRRWPDRHRHPAARRQGNRIENNRIYGNFLAGVAAVEGILLTKNPEARSLEATRVQQRVRAQRHGHQRQSTSIYDGNGTNNCFR